MEPPWLDDSTPDVSKASTQNNAARSPEPSPNLAEPEMSDGSDQLVNLALTLAAYTVRLVHAILGIRAAGNWSAARTPMAAWTV